MLDSTNAILTLIGSLAALAALMGAWWYKYGRPMTATSEAILGRAEVKDRSGAVIQPAQPGLPAQMARIAETVEQLVQMNRRVDDVTADVAELRGEVAEVKKDVASLKDAHVERVMTKVESAQAFAAIEAVANNNQSDGGNS